MKILLVLLCILFVGCDVPNITWNVKVYENGVLVLNRDQHGYYPRTWTEWSGFTTVEFMNGDEVKTKGTVIIEAKK
jgi:hypothetical protein